MMQRVLLFLVATLVSLSLFTSVAQADSEFATWEEAATEMELVLEDSYALLLAGDGVAAKEKVDVAYYGYYEKLGFERAVMSYISGDRATRVEYLFSEAKKAMLAGDEAHSRSALDELITLLHEDAARLDGKQESPVSVFGASFLIIAREGFEAILIVGALIAYLAKSGNKDKVRVIYLGSLIALAASVVMAFILNALSGAATGAQQEVVEGVTMLIAVAVLFYVSVWMISKADTSAWDSYIQGKVSSSLKRGSVFALAFAAFLAVFREGAEVILFYGALIAETATYPSMIWVGLGVGCVALVGIYLLIRFVGLRLPLKPFFVGTSILMFIMSISFIGSGIKELQEGNVVSVTPIKGISSVDLLGIYPTIETLIPQILLLLLAVGAVVFQMRRWKRTPSGANGAGGAGGASE
jgi:high-affinity iron transporter